MYIPYEILPNRLYKRFSNFKNDFGFEETFMMIIKNKNELIM